MRDQVAAGLRIILLGAVLAAGLLSARPTAPEGGQEVAPVESPGQVAARLILAHDCKREGYGTDIIPGHAIVDTGSGPRYTKSDIAFRIAFEGHPGSVYAFCI